MVKGLRDKISEPEKIVETLRELFYRETNGEVLYYGVEILEDIKDTPGAIEVVEQRLDQGAGERYGKYLKNDMALIKAGQFAMGSEDIDGDEDEKPMHDVKVDTFLISRYQITNRLYEEFDPDHADLRDEYSDKDDQPVINVNWFEAVMFCRWLGCRLPTEAEWEYVCRAGTTTPFYTGDNLTTDQGNYDGNNPYNNNPKGKYLQKTTSGGSFPANKWGVYDMHGNVDEWCMDWFDENYYEECVKKGVVENPNGPENGSYRVLRGGSWFRYGLDCRSAYRGCFSPEGRDLRYWLPPGFRPVVSWQLYPTCTCER